MSICLEKSQENGGFPSSTSLNVGGEVLSKVKEFKYSLKMCLCFVCLWIPPSGIVLGMTQWEDAPKTIQDTLERQCLLADLGILKILPEELDEVSG